MKKIVVLILAVILSISASAESLENEISSQLGLEKATELVPEDIHDDINFSPDATPSENGLSINKLFKTALVYVFDAVKNETAFVFSMLGISLMSAVLFSFADLSRPSLNTAARFAVSAIVATLLISHIENAFSRAAEYIDSISNLMTGLLPFFGSISAIGGEFSSAIVQKAILLSITAGLRTVMSSVALPVCRCVMALSIAGYVSGISLGAVAEFISGIATKIIAISCGIMCAVLYFQDTVASVGDSLALRSVKLVAGNFIPVVGSFVSEASGTLLSGVALVKSSFGVFAICVLLYMSIRPLVNFFVVKLSLRFSSLMARLLGCEREARAMSEIVSVYNILSALMIASVCFFVFFAAVFLKSEVR